VDIRWHVNAALARVAIGLLKMTGWYDGYFRPWRGAPFEQAQRRGLHILPVHFYTPVPDTTRLPEALWEKQSELAGMDLNVARSLEFLTRLAETYQAELAQIPYEPSDDPQQFFLNNSAYRAGDAEVLYSMVRHYKPRKIIEIGAGHTTLLISQALRQNAAESGGRRCEFVSIEPYLPPYLDPAPPESSRIINQELQDLPLDEFASLGDGDILFIDSSHVVKIGSDVVYEYLEILPRLQPGVIVHIHDVFLPYEYPRAWTHTARFFWNEQYLLQAFLQFNEAFETLLPLYALYKAHPETFRALIPGCQRDSIPPGAFWMRRRP
jgi:hypothetical protein